jgi:hypothetical protein
MPIILNTEPDRVRRLEIGDSVVLHTRATGDEVQSALDAAMDLKTGRYNHAAAATSLMLAHVKGWENVLDGAGDDVPFSADFVPTFVAALGYSERLQIDAAITSSYSEAVEGKADSVTGSNGID